MAEKICAIGRRKTAAARVWLIPSGNGNIEINSKSIEEYFPRDVTRLTVEYPLKIANLAKSVDLKCSVNGGGLSAQAGAIAHGIARALSKWQPELRAIIKKEGLLTRDARKKERKKYGLHGARRATQFTKR